jgi:hypothetical protein
MISEKNLSQQKKIQITDIAQHQNKLLESLSLPKSITCRLQNVTEDQKAVIFDVLALIYPNINDKDYGPKSIMATNVAILSTIIDDIVKNFNYDAQFYSKNNPAYIRFIDSLCKVMKTQTELIKEMKNISLIGLPALHIHQHAKGVPSFHDNAVVITGGINE